MMWMFLQTDRTYYIHIINKDIFYPRNKLQTCGDHTEPNLSNRAMNIRRVFDLADVGAIVGELDLVKYDGGVTARDVSSPRDTLPKDALYRRIWALLVVEHLKVDE